MKPLKALGIGGGGGGAGVLNGATTVALNSALDAVDDQGVISTSFVAPLAIGNYLVMGRVIVTGVGLSIVATTLGFLLVDFEDAPINFFGFDVQLLPQTLFDGTFYIPLPPSMVFLPVAGDHWICTVGTNASAGVLNAEIEVVFIPTTEVP